MFQTLSLTVNGVALKKPVEPTQLLVDFLRQDLALTGTHVGCDTGQCGACTIHVDGKAVKACNMLAVQAEGRSITTIEGVSGKDGSMHPMQQAFKQCHGLQCGFCTPGMVMSSIDLVVNHHCATEAQIRDSLDGNLCRCTGYQNIVKAVVVGAKAMQA
jgi:carbon-monoxide dehydrogenase small subunit